MKKLVTIVFALTVCCVWVVAQVAQQSPGQPSQPISSATVHPIEGEVEIVEGPIIRNLTQNSAELFWRTNNVTGADVRYGLDPNGPEKRKFEAPGSREHRMILTDLEPGKAYYFYIYTKQGKVRAQGQFNTRAQAAGEQVSTPSGLLSIAINRVLPDDVEIVQGPVLRNLTANSATMAWTTNKTGASDVRYGTDSQTADKRAFESGGSREHSVELPGLQPGTTYWFQISARQGATRATGHFQTPNR
jgi:Purple acid Phosphatase, N-terminal domain